MSTTFTTTNGTVWFENDNGAAAMRAFADVQNAITEAAPSLPGDGEDTNKEPPPLAPKIAAGAAVVNAGAAVATLGINIANLIARRNTSATSPPMSLEIQISNGTADSVVIVYEVDPDKADVSAVPQPIGSGSSDTLLITQPNGFNDNSAVALTMLVAGIALKLKYALEVDASKTPTEYKWKVRLLSIDGKDGSTATSTSPGNGLMGITYQSSSADGPHFSLYTTGLLSPSGQITLTVIDSTLSAAVSNGSIPDKMGVDVNHFGDPATAAASASADMLALQNLQSAPGRAPGGPAVVSALFGSIAAVANIGNVGFGLAGLVDQGAPAGSVDDTMEIEITNNSTLPVVVYSVKTNRAADAIIRIPAPLGEGESDVLVMTNPAGFEDGSPGGTLVTDVTIDMVVGVVPVTLVYTWSSTGSPGLWVLQTKVNGESALTPASANLQLLGFEYTQATAPFRLYSMPIETSSGHIDVSIFGFGPASVSA